MVMMVRAMMVKNTIGKQWLMIVNNGDGDGDGDDEEQEEEEEEEKYDV